MSRFHLPLDPPAIGDRLLAGMTRLKIELLQTRHPDGDRGLLCDVEVGGNLRPDEAPADLALLHDLLEKFSRAAAGGAV